MDADIERILAFAERVPTTTNSRVLIIEFKSLVQFLGFRHFVITGLPWNGWHFEDLIVGSNFPSEWHQRYVEGEYLRDDAVAKAAFSSVAPFSWHKAIERFGDSDRARQIARESCEFGLVDGVSFPHLDLNNRAAIASIVTDTKVDLAPHLVIVLQGMMPLLYERFWEIADLKHPGGDRLSPREVQVLKLVSAGSTLVEIATILHLGKSTVRFHLQRAREKLGSTSLPQTVAAAIRTRQI